MGFGRTRTLLAICILTAVAIPATAHQTPPVRGYVGQLVTLDLQDVPLVDVLRFFHQKFGLNFVVDSDVPAVRVTVALRDVPWNVALEAILRANGLGAIEQGPTMWNISAQPASEGLAPTAPAGKRIALTYRDADLREVVRDLRARTGANIVVADSVRPGLKVTSELGEVDWEQGLGWILWSLELRAVRRGDAIVVEPAP